MINDVLITRIENYLENKFSSHKKRLNHIYNVKKVAIALGEKYNASIPNVIVASYLHDATKIDSIEENRILASNLIYDNMPEACIHAYAATNVAKEYFGIQDEDILNSIKFHCSGRKQMSLLEKIIYVSDFIEEGREFVSDDLRELAFNDLDKAVYQIMIRTKKYILSNNQAFSDYTEEAILYYKELTEEFND